MDSRLLFALFICLSATRISSSSPSSSLDVLSLSSNVQEDAPKVQLTLYYESLCPYCSNFIVNYLLEIFENGIDAIVDLKLIPYGNAKVSSNGTITCQHGPRECLLNTVEACAIHAWPDVHDHFPFILCVETFVYKHKYADWDTCFEKLNLDAKPVTDCYNSGLGNQLELQYADVTNSLEPPHKYVPWVVVDGEPLHDDYPDFITFVCRAYEGSNLPRACLRCLTSSASQIIVPERAYPVNPVTYIEETSKSPLSKIRSAVTWLMRQANLEA